MTKEITKDYKDFSFNQLHELIGTLYKEIDRLTAERKAASEALESLRGSIQLSRWTIDEIKRSTKEAAIEALVEARKVKVTTVKKAKRKK